MDNKRSLRCILLSVYKAGASHPSGCPNGSYLSVMTKIDPTGNTTHTCIPHVAFTNDNSQWVVVQQEINSILSLGYKVIGSPCYFFEKNNITYNSVIPCTWYFAIP